MMSIAGMHEGELRRDGAHVHMVRCGECTACEQPQADPCDDRCPVPEDDDEGVGELLLESMLEDSSRKARKLTRRGRDDVSTLSCGLDGQQSQAADA